MPRRERPDNLSRSELACSAEELEPTEAGCISGDEAMLMIDVTRCAGRAADTVDAIVLTRGQRDAIGGVGYPLTQVPPLVARPDKSAVPRSP